MALLVSEEWHLQSGHLPENAQILPEIRQTGQSPRDDSRYDLLLTADCVMEAIKKKMQAMKVEKDKMMMMTMMMMLMMP